MAVAVMGVISIIFGFFTFKKDGAIQTLRVLKFQTGIIATRTGPPATAKSFSKGT